MIVYRFGPALVQYGSNYIPLMVTVWVMARNERTLGSYELPPKMPLSEAVRLSKTIAEHFKDDDFDAEALASGLGHHSVRSGTFHQKVADLKRYGAVEGRGSKLHVSTGALSIYRDHPGDKENAALEMLRSIPIYKAIYEQFGDRIPDDRAFNTWLLNITKAPRQEVENEAGKLRDLYRDACGMVGPMTSGARPSGMPIPTISHAHSATPLAGGRRFAVSTEDYEFSVADEPETIGDVVEQLQAHKRALERRREAGRGVGAASTEETASGPSV
jgi:hypothetical protein